MKTDVTKMTDAALTEILNVLERAKVRVAYADGVWDILFQVKLEYKSEAKRRKLFQEN